MFLLGSSAAGACNTQRFYLSSATFMAWVVGKRARCVWYGWFAISSERARFSKRGGIGGCRGLLVAVGATRHCGSLQIAVTSLESEVPTKAVGDRTPDAARDSTSI